MKNDAALAHYGVKGMKWGVRKADKAAAAARPSSDDAKRSGELRSVAKASGTRVLSNKELEEVIRRMSLEKQYNTLRPQTTKDVIRGIVSKALLNAGQQEANRQAGEALRKLNNRS